MKSGLANHTNTPAGIIENLSKDEEKYVRNGVTGKTNTSKTPMPIGEWLIKDNSNGQWLRHDSHETLGKISGAVYSDARKRKNVSFSIRETSR